MARSVRRRSATCSWRRFYVAPRDGPYQQGRDSSLQRLHRSHRPCRLSCPGRGSDTPSCSGHAMTRRHDLDWVRVLAFALLVLYHVGMYYVSWEWHVDSPHAGPALEPFMMMSSPWRLSLLFLVSGVATAFLLGKVRREAAASGIRPRFLGPRSWRLLLPLVFGMLVIVPPQSYYEVVEKLPGGYGDGYLAFWARYLAGDGSFCRGDDCLDLPTWNHLWFVAYLWVYTVVAVLLARSAPRVLDRSAARLGALLASGPALLLWPALLLALVRMLLVGRFESTHALVDDWYNHAQYFGVFLFGFLVA